MAVVAHGIGLKTLRTMHLFLLQCLRKFPTYLFQVYTVVTRHSHVQCGVFLTLRMTSGSARWNLSARLPSSVNFTVYLRRPPYELICSITQTLPTVKQCCIFQVHVRRDGFINILFTLHYKTSIRYLPTVNKSSNHNKLVCFGLTLDVELILTFFLHYTNSIHYLPTVNKSSIHNNNINRSTEEVENSWLFALCDCANLRCLCWKTEHPWVLHNVLLNFEKSLFVEWSPKVVSRKLKSGHSQSLLVHNLTWCFQD